MISFAGNGKILSPYIDGSRAVCRIGLNYRANLRK